MLLIAITFTGILGTISFSATGNAQDDDDDSGGSSIWWQNSQSSEGKAIPDWVDQNFRWYGQGQITQTELLNAMKYLLDNNIMFISEEAATEVQQLRDENIQLKIRLGEQLGEVQDTENDADDKIEIGINLIEKAKESTSDPESQSRVKVQFPWMVADFDFASQMVNDILTKGGTTSVWEDGIDSFSQHGMSESDVPELIGTVVLFNNAIDKKAQSIDAELKILEMWLEIISNEQESSAYDASGRLTSDTTESTVQYRESDFNFISRTLSSIDQQIMALDTGIEVLQEKIDESETQAQDKASDYTQFVQLSTQLEELQTTSNILKAKHDTQMNSIRNMRVS